MREWYPLPVALKWLITRRGKRSVICCVRSGSRTVAVAQKPSGKRPISGSAAARRMISSSSIALAAPVKGGDGGTSSKCSKRTTCGFFVDFPLMSTCPSCRDQPDIIVSARINDTQYVFIGFPQRYKSNFLIITSGILSLEDWVFKDRHGRPERNAMFSLVRSILFWVPLIPHQEIVATISHRVEFTCPPTRP